MLVYLKPSTDTWLIFNLVQSCILVLCIFSYVIKNLPFSFLNIMHPQFKLKTF